MARGFHNRSIPVDVIVIDYFHWKKFGDWSFDESKWPDPKAMVDECRSYGMEIMVSVWPFSCPGSRSYDTLVKNNWITTRVGADGERTNVGIESHGKDCRLVDPTNPDFRKYLWSLIESGYYQYGIKIFWLDASEPEGFGPLSLNASWQAGTMRDLGSMFTLYWTQAFYDGLQSHGETDIVMLPRSGWVGTWRHGGVLWSGDIGTTMTVLKGQMNIGLSAQMSGIPWWTTDIGGYGGGSAEDPTYHEIIVRWFQYGVTCPLFRQHGARDHTAPWFYGPETEKMLEDIIKLRGDLKSYISSQLNLLNATGRPFNRPLMWDFPEDPKTWELAENGIGGKIPPDPATLEDGDFVVLAECNATSWNQKWSLNKAALTPSEASGKCLDDGGSKGARPPTGPYPVHVWSCASQWQAAQTWSYDATQKQFVSEKKNVCLNAGQDNHPDIGPCDPSDKTQQWTFTQGGSIVSSKGLCLAVVPQEVGGVADQFMMGDDYMVAPILSLGQRNRQVYFPLGADWTHYFFGKKYVGGTIATVDAPLNSFPLFKRVDASQLVV